MSYLVLARKHRPQTFDQIVGQEHIVRTLQNAIATERLHHAFLFTGARGVGKTTTARVLARALDCEGPDLFEIDAASNTGVDNVRELRDNVRYMPSRGTYKIYLIDEVHMLSQAAFNALLKTLEEPPAHVKFIFATTEPQKVPVTILSRCQRFDFRRVSVARLVEHLTGILQSEGIAVSPDALTSIAREAQGSVRDALSLLDHVLSFAGPNSGVLEAAEVSEALGVVDRETLFRLCDAVLERRGDRILETVAEVDARGHDLGDVAELVVEHLRDLMVVKVVDAPGESLLDRSPGEIESLRGQASKRERADLHRLFRLAVGVAEDVARASQPRVSLEMGLLRLLEVEPTHGLSELLLRLERLAQGADGDGGASVAGPDSGAEEGRPRRRSPPALSPVVSPPAPVVASSQASSPARPRNESSAASPPATGENSKAEATSPDAMQGWRQVVADIHRERPALASVLEHGQVVDFGPEGVELAFPPDTFYWEQARDTDHQALLTRSLTTHFGAPVPLKVRKHAAAEAHQSSLVAMGEQRRREWEEALHSEATAHPMVRTALEVLEAEVEEVQPLTPERSH